MTEPIDVTLVAVRKRIAQAEYHVLGLERGWTRQLLEELAAEAGRLVDYVGQPDPEKVAVWARASLGGGHLTAAEAEALRPMLAAYVIDGSLPTALIGLADRLHPPIRGDVECAVHGVVPAQPSGGCRLCDEGEVPEEDDVAWNLDMSAIVDELKERYRTEVAAYVEQTGGGCATIYAARLGPDGEPELYDVLDVSAATGAQTTWQEWPILGGPGSFDWNGVKHLGSLDEFYVGPNASLWDDEEAREKEYRATRRDTPATLADRIAELVLALPPLAQRIADAPTVDRVRGT